MIGTQLFVYNYTMKHPTFYLDGRTLEQYLNTFEANPETKDYEHVVAFFAMQYFKEVYGKEFYVAYETNNKPKDPIPESGLTMDLLRKIFTENLAENTDVDFCLVPAQSIKNRGYAYPFQLKRFYLDSEAVPVKALSAFINTKANEYTSENTSLLVVPLQRKTVYTKGISLKKLKEELVIRDNALWAIYLYQVFDTKPKLVPLWVSTRASKESAIN